MKEPRENKSRFPWGRFVGWAVLALLALWFFSKIYTTLSVFFMALLIAYLIHPLAHFVSCFNIPVINRKIPWFPSILIVYLLLLTILVLTIVILIPSAVDQVKNIIEELPRQAVKLDATINTWKASYERFDIPLEFKNRIDQSITEGITKIGDILGRLFQAISSVLITIISWLLFLIISSVISFFVLSNLENLKKSFYSIIPKKYDQDVRELISEINNIFGRYVRGFSVASIINGVLTSITLFIVVWIFRTAGYGESFPFFKYTLVTSVVAGLTYFIPYLGCTLSVVVGLSLAYLQNPSVAYIFTIGLTVLLTNQFVDTVVRTQILGNYMGVSPVFVAFSAIAGGEIMGVWGLLVGIPIGVMLVSIIRFVFRRFLSATISEPGIIASKTQKLDPQQAASRDGPEEPPGSPPPSADGQEKPAIEVEQAGTPAESKENP